MIVRIGLAVSLVVALGAIALGVARVGWLEDLEVNFGNEVTLRNAAEAGEAVLGQIRLNAGTHAEFELCASDPMAADTWAGAMDVQLRLDGEVGLTVSFDDESLERVRRNETSGCLNLGSGPVLSGGEYTIVAVFEALPEAIADVPLRTRIVARRELEDVDLMVVVFVWSCSMLLVVWLAVRAGPSKVSPETPQSIPLWAIHRHLRRDWRLWAGLGGLCLVFVGIGFVGRGAAAGLAGGVALGIFEVGIALALIGGGSLAMRADLCALVRPQNRWWLWFPAAGFAGIVLMLVAQIATSLVPSTSTSSVQLFVSWPSGMLSFAALAVAAPLAEEIFFRGFIYGYLKRYGTVIAFLGAWLIFVAMHGSQTWGQWGALVGIGITGLGLTAIRAISGSALVAATAHLVYNGLLAVQAFV